MRQAAESNKSQAASSSGRGQFSDILSAQAEKQASAEASGSNTSLTSLRCDIKVYSGQTGSSAVSTFSTLATTVIWSGYMTVIWQVVLGFYLYSRVGGRIFKFRLTLPLQPSRESCQTFISLLTSVFFLSHTNMSSGCCIHVLLKAISTSSTI